jgi:hypothetical protein
MVCLNVLYPLSLQSLKLLPLDGLSTPKMASEKTYVTATTEPYISEVGLDSTDDANPQDYRRDFAPTSRPNNGMLEVGLLK